MTKQSIITIALCMIICASYVEGATTLVTPSLATTDALAQKGSADTANSNAQLALTAAFTAMGQQNAATATLMNDMTTQQALMTKLVGDAARANAALRLGQQKAMDRLNTLTQQQSAVKASTQTDTCTGNVQTWLTTSNNLVQKFGTDDIKLGAGQAYQNARDALKVPSDFSKLLNTLTAKTAEHNTWLTEQLAVQTQQLKANMKGTSYTTDDAAVLDITAWSQLETNCPNTMTQASGDVCKIANFKEWLPIMKALVETTGPVFYQSKGAQQAWQQYKTYFDVSGNDLETLYDSDVAGKLTAEMASVKGEMDTYRTEAAKLKGALAAAVQAVNTAVQKDDAAATGTALAAKTYDDAALAQNAAKTAVTDAKALTGAWGVANKAVMDARAALKSATSTMVTSVNEQLTLQVAVQQATLVNLVAQSLDTGLEASVELLNGSEAKWAAEDRVVDTALAAAKSTLAAQKSSTNLEINPPKTF